MAKCSAHLPLAGLELDRASARPLHRQLYDALREAILTGRLRSGLRLPATRVLAGELGLSRNTVVSAFEQLLAEGYLEGRVGSGTYIASTLPDELLQAPQHSVITRQAGRRQLLSRRGAVLATTPVSRASSSVGSLAFRPGLPALDAFPFETWSRLMARHWRRPPAEVLGYGHAAGYWPLREAIAAYLGAARGVRCRPEQVIIVSGSQQALDLSSRVLLDPGDQAWLEEPGYQGARGALLAAGAQVVPVPVDEQGLDVAAGIARAPQARLAYISPSHQYPLGVTMSLSRRLALLEWASRAGAWVLEDDYDSEYRYASRPLAALQGLDNEGRVIYGGTFSKVLLPALRLGYLVVPEELADAFVNARSLIDRHAPMLEQVALADFMLDGHFERHIRRMRALYAERQALIVEEARRELGGLLEVAPADSGMHLIGWLPPGVDDVAASQRAAAYGVDAPALSLYAVEPLSRHGLLLGYAAPTEREIRQGVRRLVCALTECRV